MWNIIANNPTTTWKRKKLSVHDDIKTLIVFMIYSQVKDNNNNVNSNSKQNKNRNLKFLLIIKKTRRIFFVGCKVNFFYYIFLQWKFYLRKKRKNFENFSRERFKKKTKTLVHFHSTGFQCCYYLYYFFVFTLKWSSLSRFLIWCSSFWLLD